MNHIKISLNLTPEKFILIHKLENQGVTLQSSKTLNTFCTGISLKTENCVGSHLILPCYILVNMVCYVHFFSYQ